MRLIFWGSDSDRHSATTATDLTESEFIQNFLTPSFGTSYGIYSSYAITEEQFNKWQLAGRDTITRAGQKLGRRG